jgi:hypothetical protein
MTEEQELPETEQVETPETQETPEPEAAPETEEKAKKDWRDSLQDAAKKIVEREEAPKKRGRPPKAKEESADTQDEPASEPKPEPKVEAIDPPTYWKKEHRDVYGKLPPEAQKVIRDYEDNRTKFYNTKVQEVAEQRKRIEAFENILEPERDRLRMQGIGDDAYIRALVAADNLLRTNPQRGLELLMQQYGINAGQAGQLAHSLPAQMAQQDPRLQQLEARLTELQAERQHEQARQMQEQIQSFAKQNPFFADVREDMATLLNSGAAADLQEAYTIAVMKNPETRQAYLQSVAPQPINPASNPAAIESVRRAAAVAHRPKAVVSGEVVGKDWRDTLRLTAQRMNGEG